MNPSNPKVNEKIATGVPVGAVSQTEGPWSTGLCDCFSDVPGCCLACWCPCITFGQIAEIVDKGTTPCGVHGALYGLLMLVAGCACCYSCFYRTKMRKQYNIEGSPCVDFLTHFCCEACALCQEHRELKTRGFDMSFGVGWNENMERQNRGVSMTTPTAPVVESGMKR